MEKHIGMRRQPRFISLMNAIIVKDNMNLFIRWNLSHDLIHKCKKICSLFKICCARMNNARRHLQSSKKIQRSMSLIGAFNLKNA